MNVIEWKSALKLVDKISWCSLPAMLNQQSIQNKHWPKLYQSQRSLAPLINPAVPYSDAGKEAKVFPGSEGKEDDIMLRTDASVFPDFRQIIYVTTIKNKMVVSSVAHKLVQPQSFF